jgi:hypothetical protein
MKIFSKNAYYYSYIDRQYYYKSLVVKNSLPVTLEYLTKEHRVIFDTARNVMFKDLAWGISPRQTVNKLGRIRYKVENSNEFENHQILFFKRGILAQKAVMQCHFLRNELYFIHIDFHSSLSNELGFVSDMVFEKYLPTQTAAGPNTCIRDRHDNKLILNNEVTLNISYISGKPAIMKDLQKELLAQKNRQTTPAKRFVMEL